MDPARLRPRFDHEPSVAAPLSAAAVPLFLLLLQFAVVIAFLAFNFFRRTDGGASALMPAAVTTTAVAVNAQPTKPSKATRSAH